MLTTVLLLLAAAPDWVPMRWISPEPSSLELLANSPVNCLLLDAAAARPEFAQAAKAKNLTALAVIRPGAESAPAAKRALAAGFSGLVLEGDFPAPERDQLRKLGAPHVIELTARGDLARPHSDPIIGTFQGVWPGINVKEDAAAQAAPTGAPLIDTNSGFLRFLRATLPREQTIWLAYAPPPKSVYPAERYLQAIADAALGGARWIITLDADLAARLEKREPRATRDWTRINQLLTFLEAHKDWRPLPPHGKLALVQSAATGGLLSGSILDMIAVKHTPVRPVPPDRISAASLAPASLIVDVDPSALSDSQQSLVKDVARRGGTVLTGAPGWKMPPPRRDQVTLDKADIEKLDAIWRDVNNIMGRRNLGVRLFNVSSMLSNLTADPSGKRLVLHLVNYSNYPVDSITAHVLGKYAKATLWRPDRAPKEMSLYEIEEGTGIDIDEVGPYGVLVIE